jgi:hypothetical protein
VIARRTDCGVRERWQPLQERWDESELCFVGEAVEIRVFRKHNEFFQRQQTLIYECPAGSRVFDRSEPVGAQWTWQCRTSDAQIDTVTKVLGIEQRTVSGRQVELVRMRYESTLTGSSRGTQFQERLIEPKTGRVFSIKSDIDVQTNSPFGEVGYKEHYLIEALTIEPRT